MRHFNTSRTLKKVHDTSTIDFAFLPDIDPDNVEAFEMRVPIIPTNFSPTRTGAHAHEVEEIVSICAVCSKQCVALTWFRRTS